MINYTTKSLNLEGGFTTLVRVFFTGTVCGIKIGFGSKAGLHSLKAGCHCFQLVSVVLLVEQLPSEIPDFDGILDCLNWFHYIGPV